MSRTSASLRRRGTSYPVNTWYAIATRDEIGRQPLARRVLDTPVVLYRTQDGRVVALEDRDAHRPYPLSLGTVDGDTIVSGYSGFAYSPTGACVHVPTQPHVPIGAGVKAFPVLEQDGLIWIWLGAAALAHRRNPPHTAWLAGDGWVTLGDEWETQANLLLLHDNFADITHVPVVDPFIAPPALAGVPPALEVEVSENAVAFSRNYPPARLTGWHAEVLGLSSDTEHAQREEGGFVTPGLWANAWHVYVDGDDARTFRFTHAVTPVSSSRTRHVWRVSRNFAPNAEVSARLLPIFTAYYRRVQQILETMQHVIDVDGPRDEVSVNSDAAALQVRRVVNRMIAEERLA
ncbi:Rieske 2Fe-2S domain-containing protein [Mycolicibacterium sp.]|uniref:aromatic ring-hydroxylating dioxygenase subunit alpha n=1 Tax=Mycolicibacterium sp. TaxID=2320850 RepID=UPI001A32D288|nr:Rieske 2Fe-2S domain-containing protein [Mycolicibacterium sp.]MBJ7337982.1 Rieske 2Fe-2S domain-containing protein [Mycolicibacterium sp.]